MKYVFRFSARVKEKLDTAAPKHEGKRSGIIRDALTAFLRKAKQSLADRPKLRGTSYKQVCVSGIDEELIAAVERKYPTVSVSVVAQAAVVAELRKPRYKMPDFPSLATDDNEKTNADADEHSKRHAGRTKGHRGKA